MKRPIAWIAVLALACAPRAAHASGVCNDCVNTNDTTSTPGRTALPYELAGYALNPPIAFVDANHRIACALPSPSGWAIDVVHPQPGGGGLSMAVDAAGEPSIAFHDANGVLLRAHRVGGAWTEEPIDPASTVTGGTSLARTAGGLAIAYVDGPAGVLRYAEQDAGGAWHAEVVGPVGDAEAYPSLRIDEPVRAISYRDATTGALRLAVRQAGGGWATEPVDDTGDVGGYSSLVGGPSHGGFGVAYYDFANQDLRYARSLPGGGWAIELVDGVGRRAGRFCSAYAFGGGPDEGVGIAYEDRDGADLDYAYRSNGLWTVVALDTAGELGRGIACGGTPVPGDTLGVTYLDRATGDLRYRWGSHATASVPRAPAPAAGLQVSWRRAATRAGGTIHFVVPAAGPVRVRVYDALGRVVATPLDRDLGAGAADVAWGAGASAGVFLVRVEAAGVAGTTRAVLLR